ncbi:t-SNARE [Komagataella phaffii CBS 7435]|uniref:Plasma membrane t-SNARE involved in fusion of secretory vesicles at the plasma membrane n=2 Tax=Komagataella phaffii TaxID=460519 RepID=C4QY09_KOMPG|nr:Plasma membrane t-SNARE involved in fusion of secretory vesicles at the plasma membrane [Komagataella phaffii GS115]AOA61847.1 GQ67_01881T0 [Komagataella phaffii]CAH2446951.1 t-SNARE [Komagataella phaffii CBS 7435]AOA66864.1 GQ68_01896T0 [Komagataella phaffii GS115]CAY68132.1 Plasma membrane t-SNARE involved in fusion of secretory vesicles at the plasma membrane [Komagataella phaffii GS115]CCA37207.1 t-SNARE [Komagataella phaffii CBS 7435]
MSNQYNPYEQNQSYELPSYKGGNNDDFVKFMNEIADINANLDNYEELVKIIEQKQTQLVNEVNPDQENSLKRQLDSLISESSSLQLSLKSKIKNAQQLAIGDSAKVGQAETSRQRFLQAIQDYRIIESNYREQQRVQAERQYRVVKPDASPEEVRDAIDDLGGQQVFSTALLNANRRGEAKTALQEVQSRHRELQRLEKTMAELTQLFHDMEEMVVEQDQHVQETENLVDTAQQDIEKAVGHTDKALTSAKKARRKKCICFWICVLIICILALILGLGFGVGNWGR